MDMQTNTNNKPTNMHTNSTENLCSRVSAEEMDEKRHQNIAYEYLCHLEEAKKYFFFKQTLIIWNFRQKY